jgi:hypothetical protein
MLTRRHCGMCDVTKRQGLSIPQSPYLTAATQIEILWISLFFRRKRHAENVATDSTPRSTLPTIWSLSPKCIINTTHATNEIYTPDTPPSRQYSFQNNTVSVINNALMQLLFKLTIYSTMKTKLICHKNIKQNHRFLKIFACKILIVLMIKM